MEAMSRKLRPTIPIVMCPMCAMRMRFATYEPTERDDCSKMTFDCSCGFRYQLSETAAEALTRNAPKARNTVLLE